MITAMTYLFIILVIAAAMVVKTVNLLLHDGRGPAAPPSSHFQDPQFAAPAPAGEPPTNTQTRRRPGHLTVTGPSAVPRVRVISSRRR